MLAAGIRWKLFDFLVGIFFNFNGVLPGNDTVKFLYLAFFYIIQCKVLLK